MVSAAEDYELWRAGDGEQKLKFVERPVLRWSNPVRVTNDGAVFLWTDKGRPAAALCIYEYGVDDVAHEWQSLAAGPLRATYRQRMVWQPQVAGLEFNPVPGDDEPAASTPARRLAQMHRLLRDFTATFGREPRRHELRALTQPIYRYGEPETEIVDGAIFAFAQATDPEVLLLLEARAQKHQAASWWWAAARMSMVHLEVKHRGELVWTIDWNQRRDERQPYMTFRHKRIDLPGDAE
ncbi:MAG: hypothetical protein B7Z73_15885 [Planctomycetia bacterium 21-64-5]|nr:MAG: hypothetical protein B7Z73_15885 [Planctomycetia bacterium 21-64-5]